MKKPSKNQPDADPKPDSNKENKIQRHLSQKDDTISEEDIEKINTDIKSEDDMPGGKSDSDNDERPKKELPTVWDIID